MGIIYSPGNKSISHLWKRTIIDSKVPYVSSQEGILPSYLGSIKRPFSVSRKKSNCICVKNLWQLNFFTVSLQSLHIKKNHSKKPGANFYLCFFLKKWRQQKCQVAGGYETLMMRVSFNHFRFPSDLAHKTLGFLGVFHLFASTPKKNAHQKGGNGIVVRVPRWHSRITWSDLGTCLVLLVSLVSLVLFHRKTSPKSSN